jgi:hypothetical protein
VPANVHPHGRNFAFAIGFALVSSGFLILFKLAEAAEKSWHRLNGHNQLPKIILGIKFSDGIEIVRSQAQPAAA